MTNAELQRDLETDPIVRFAHAIDTLCNGDGCLVYFGDDVARRIVSFDGAHLTPLDSINCGLTLTPWLQFTYGSAG